MPIRIKHKGDFSATESYLRNARRKSRIEDQASIVANACVSELKRVTPKDSGLTAESWDYSISISGHTVTITYFNKNIQNGLNVALLIEYGHATPSGKWVEGQEYIDTVVRKIYLDVVNNKWKELEQL